jgi:hypothetical protein
MLLAHTPRRHRGYTIGMTLFKNYTFTWWQVGILKLAVLLFGIAIGANWPVFFAAYTLKLVLVAVVLVIYLLYVCFKK